MKVHTPRWCDRPEDDDLRAAAGIMVGIVLSAALLWCPLLIFVYSRS